MIDAIYTDSDELEEVLSAGALVLRNIFNITGMEIPKLLLSKDSTNSQKTKATPPSSKADL